MTSASRTRVKAGRGGSLRVRTEIVVSSAGRSSYLVTAAGSVKVDGRAGFDKRGCGAGVDCRAGAIVARGETGWETGVDGGEWVKKGRFARSHTWIGVGSCPVRVKKSDVGPLWLLSSICASTSALATF